MAANTSVNGLPVASGIELVPTSRLADRLRPIFPFDFFNAMQSKSFPYAYNRDDNFVLSAPTGSGKTAMLELAICSFIVNCSPADIQKFKVIYQAPTKALCAERQRDWSKKFGRIGLQCQELTGDTEQAQLYHVQRADIIITTPEKWDSVTRRWRDHRKLADLVKLFLIDEVHILKEDRGASLEAVVSRMKTIGNNVRFVALSATVPNSEDIAAWLGRNSSESHVPALRQVFGEQFRPVRLVKHVLGLPSITSSDWGFEHICNSQLPDVIARYSEGKPTMIFCFTRKSTAETAKALAHWWQSSDSCERYWQIRAPAPTVSDGELRGCIQAGVAYHHAGLDQSDRLAVERSFIDGGISTLCCTSTLAVGVNLPCHLVIIKNTVTYNAESQSCKEYSDLDVMQMLGRAGRPQFDDTATAVIITRPDKVRRYEKMVQGQEILESRLHLNLIEHLNAEIGLGTIFDRHTACAWLESTFLFVRLAKNPHHYRVEGDAPTKSLQERARLICSRDIDRLLQYDLASGEHSIKLTEYGHAMSRYYVQFNTMKLIVSLQEKAKISEILSAIAQSAELGSLHIKGGERAMYKEINSSPMLKYPIKVNLDLPAHKASLIIQAALGGVDVESDSRFGMHQRQYRLDTLMVVQHAKRLLRCIIDCKLDSKDSIGSRNALELARGLGAHAWDDSPHQLSQLENVGPVAVRKLVSCNIRTIEDLEATEPHKIDMALSKNPPFGALLLQKLKGFPKLRVSLKTISKPSLKYGGGVEVRIKAEIGFLNDQPPTFWRRALIQVYLLAETSDGRLAHFARASGKAVGDGQAIDFIAELFEPHQMVTCYAACDNIAGTLKYATLDPKISPVMFRDMAKNKTLVNNSQQPKNSHTSAACRPSPSSLVVGDDFDDDGLDDNDFVTAAPESMTKATQSGDFLDIDDLFSGDSSDNEPLSKSVLSGQGVQRKPLSELRGTRDNRKTPPSTKDLGSKTQHSKYLKPNGSQKLTAPTKSNWRPERLSSGKWKCSHACKDKQKCKHQCCKTGMDVPPRGPPKMQQDDGEYEQSSIWKSFLERNQAGDSGDHILQASKKVMASSKDQLKRKNCRPPIASHLKYSAPSARPPTASTAYGDDPFADELADGINSCTQPPSYQALNNSATRQNSSHRGRSLFVQNTSSPEKVDAQTKEDVLDDMPLAKRRRTATGEIATLSDIEAGTHHASFHRLGEENPPASSPPGAEWEELFNDERYGERNWSPGMGGNDELAFSEAMSGAIVREADTEQREEGFQIVSKDSHEDAIDSDDFFGDGFGLGADNTSTNPALRDMSELDNVDQPSERVAEASHAATDSDGSQAKAMDQQEVAKRQEEDDATAWVLREFGDYVEVVD